MLLQSRTAIFNKKLDKEELLFLRMRTVCAQSRMDQTLPRSSIGKGHQIGWSAYNPSLCYVLRLLTSLGDLMNSINPELEYLPFGGKFVVFGGDFGNFPRLSQEDPEKTPSPQA
jgi:hypothetical protein